METDKKSKNLEDSFNEADTEDFVKVKKSDIVMLINWVNMLSYLAEEFKDLKKKIDDILEKYEEKPNIEYSTSEFDFEEKEESDWDFLKSEFDYDIAQNIWEDIS